MKKLFTLFVAMLLAMTANAYDLELNGIYYNLKGDGSLEVAGSSTTYVDIPSSITINNVKYRVTSIGAYAFQGRSDLSYLSIPYSIKSIGEYAFSSCGSSITVNIADPESWCQMQLANLHASPLSSAGKMLVHDIETTSFTVPETVTSIGAFTFYQCSCLKSLYVPGSVTSIESSAFEDCDYLTSLTLSNGLQKIGGSAFEGCIRLGTLTIPSTVNTIMINAFKNCQSLTDVYCNAAVVPNTDASAFNGVIMENVTLHVPDNAVNAYKSTWPWSNFKMAGQTNPQDLQNDGLSYSVKGDGTLEVTGLASWTTVADIPSSVTINGTKYRVTSIGAYAFQGRSDLTYLSIPYSIKSIGEYAFSSCGSSITVNIADPESWCQMQLANLHASPLSSAGKMLVRDIETTSFTVPETVTSIGAFTFYQCSCLKSLYIPGSVTSIESSAFEDCDYLTSLTLSNGLQKIGGSAFEGCIRLGTLTIPSTVNTIMINAFKNCQSLTDVYCNAAVVPNTDASAFNGVIMENVTLHVPDNAVNAYKSTWPWSNFKMAGQTNPQDLQNDGIIYSVKGDGTLEVTGLASWTTVADIPSSVTINGTKYRVTSIGAYAFQGRSDLTYLSIPYSIKSIGEYAFSSCGSSITVNIADPESWCQMQLANLHASPLSSAGKRLVRDIETTSFTVPETVTSIGAFTFYQCSCLKTLYIPGSVKSIESSAFEDCDYLTSLTLSEGLQSIGGSAFEGCIRLGTLILPSTVNTISVNAFKNCRSLTDVYCNAANVPNTEASAFNGVILENVTLHVPDNSVNAYKSTWPWSNFKMANTDGINAVNAEATDADIYSINGYRTSKLQRGLNIIRQSDGKVRKVLVR